MSETPPSAEHLLDSAVPTLPEHRKWELRPLLERDTAFGHDLEQVWRKDNVAVFARSIHGKAPHEYEVVVVKIAQAEVAPSGSVLASREIYPSSNKWGKFGWSIPKRDRAVAWAETVLANLARPQKERIARADLFSRFKRSALGRPSRR